MRRPTEFHLARSIPIALRWALIGAALSAWSCDECKVDEQRCDGNKNQFCLCDIEPCEWTGADCEEELGEGALCRQVGTQAECVTPEPCPDGERESHCAENIAVQCFDGYLVETTDCAGKEPCTISEAGVVGAFCGAPSGRCLAGLVQCDGPPDPEYGECNAEGFWIGKTCPEGTTCDPDITSGNPCRPVAESRLDGG